MNWRIKPFELRLLAAAVEGRNNSVNVLYVEGQKGFSNNKIEDQ